MKVQPGSRNVDAACNAFAVGAGLDARQGGLDRRELDDFVIADGELDFLLGRHLGGRLLRMTEVGGSGLDAADVSAALRGHLCQQGGAHGDQLLLVGGGVLLVHGGFLLSYGFMMNHTLRSVFDESQDSRW
jgi:hypothetical protein